MYRLARALALFAISASLVAVQTDTQERRFKVSGSHKMLLGKRPSSGTKAAKAGCNGVYRWDIKTLCDEDSADLFSQYVEDGEFVGARSTSPAALGRLKTPKHDGFTKDELNDLRFPGAEHRLYKVTGTIVTFKKEPDCDYHVVIEDSNGHRMNVEIVAPSNLRKRTPFKPFFMDVRRAFNEQMKAFDIQAESTHSYTTQVPAGTQITVFGFGYFDLTHEGNPAKDMLPNTLELHPVVAIEF